MSLHILEKLQIVAGFVPGDLQAAKTGDYVSFKNFGRCAIVLIKAAGTAGDDPVITLTQATDVSGSDVKNLTFLRLDVKQGAALTAIEQFTTITNTDETYTQTDAAEAQAIWVIDVSVDDLDLANGFNSIKAAIGDTGSAAQLGALLYLMHDPRNVSIPLPSAITD